MLNMLNGIKAQNTFFTSIVLTLAISACSSSSEIEEAASSIELPESASMCQEPRPQVCTMIYKPVCAYDKAGSTNTEASDCSACAKADVIAYTDGECTQAPEA